MANIIEATVKEAVNEIARQRKQDLYNLGAGLVESINQTIVDTITKKSKPSEPPKAVSKSLEILKPIIDPIQQGVIDAAKPKAIKYGSYVVGGILSIFIIGFIAGRITKKSH